MKLRQSFRAKKETLQKAQKLADKNRWSLSLWIELAIEEKISRDSQQLKESQNKKK